MVEPRSFGFNIISAKTNKFQQPPSTEEANLIQTKALNEFSNMVQGLKQIGIKTFVFKDIGPENKPDALFPNNWISFGADGSVYLYPMLALNRRLERRTDILKSLKSHFKIINITDYSSAEKNEQFLEGTGSMVFDHSNKVAYASLSERTHKGLFIEACKDLNMQPVWFHAHDQNNSLIYHTNVMMSIGSGYAIICLESISNQQEKLRIKKWLEKSNLEIIDISKAQLHQFCGNVLETQNTDGEKFLTMSSTAKNNFSPSQLCKLEKYCKPISFHIPTIEKVGGGGVRCMMAEIFCPPLE